MKYKIAFHAICFSILLSATGFAGVVNLQFNDLAGKPIPDVTITVKLDSVAGPIATYTLVSDTDGSAAVTYNGPSVSSCSATHASFTVQKSGFQFNFNDIEGQVPCSFGVIVNRQIIGTDLPLLTNVSAADYQARFTSDMIAAAFGDGLATTTESATLPLKTTLAGRRLIIKDSAGREKAARLLFVSPTQINYISPEELAPGKGLARLTDENDNVLKVGFVTAFSISPSIFTADASGHGVPAAVIVRASSGYQVYETVYRFDLSQQKVIPAEIDLGTESETVVLALFGTGWRQIEPTAKVTVKIGDIDCPVEYAGKQGTIEGLAQINVRLLRSLVGKGDATVEVAIGGIRANSVQIKIK